MSWLFLAIAILLEISGTACMKLSESFSRLWPSLALMICYVLSSVFMTLSLRTIPLGVAYAIWSGVGTALAVAIGVALFGEQVTPMKLVSAGLIVIGVIGLRIF
ncbi:MAG: multidrug efflux SMR transporter [Chitinophagaceae bacterium]|nr:multidrug efflux SMR transporter [Oligoflexus sp.]